MFVTNTYACCGREQLSGQAPGQAALSRLSRENAAMHGALADRNGGAAEFRARAEAAEATARVAAEGAARS